MLVFAYQMFVFSSAQPRIAAGHGRGDDGVVYGRVADQMLSGLPIRGAAPFVYRIGGSWIAAQYARAFELSVDDAFQETSLLMAGTVLLLIYWMALDFSSPVFAAVAACLYTLPWWSYARCVWFYPALNDLPWMIIVIVALRWLVRWPSHDHPPSIARVVGFAVLCFLACLMRETGVVLPLVFLLSRLWVRSLVSLEVLIGDEVRAPPPSARSIGRDVALASFFFVAAGAGIALTRQMVTATGNYRFSVAALESIQRNTLWHFALSAFLAAGGPLVALPVVYHRYLRGRLRHTPWVLPFCGCVVALSYLGGANTLRFLSWASPVVLVLLAHLAEKLWLEPLTKAGKRVCRGFLLASLVLYLGMVHPFSGYFQDYTAWIQWGGLQFSAFTSAQAIVPCLGLALLFTFVARSWISDGRGHDRPCPPYPESPGPPAPC
jgi:hypothetical protein